MEEQIKTDAISPGNEPAHQGQSGLPRSNPRRMRTTNIIVISIALNLLVTASLFYAYDTIYALKIKTVDLRAYKEELIVKLMAKQIEEDQIGPLMISLKDKLRSEDPHKNTVFLLKEVIAHGNIQEIKP